MRASLPQSRLPDSGKEAGTTLIRTTDVNTAPGSNAVATITAFAHAERNAHCGRLQGATARGHVGPPRSDRRAWRRCCGCAF